MHLSKMGLWLKSAKDNERKGINLWQQGKAICCLISSERNMVGEKILNEATRRLVERFHPERIILFGSQARGTADNRSDADFLIITDFTGKRRSLVLEMDRALRGLGIARDIVVLTPDEFTRDAEIPGTIARPALREGKVLYERH
jgi:uncharacterized protein